MGEILYFYSLVKIHSLLDNMIHLHNSELSLVRSSSNKINLLQLYRATFFDMVDRDTPSWPHHSSFFKTFMRGHSVGAMINKKVYSHVRKERRYFFFKLVMTLFKKDR